MKIIKVAYNGGKNTSYFVKNRRGYLPVFFDEGVFHHLNEIKSEVEVDFDLSGNLMVVRQNKVETNPQEEK
jgi:hypothetical protein